MIDNGPHDNNGLQLIYTDQTTQRQNSLHIKFFPIAVEGGGGIKNQFFSKFKKVQIILGGEGSRKLWTFSTNYGIFYFEPSP